jgi:hypothetical protein
MGLPAIDVIMVSLFMQDGESRPEQTSRVTAVNSSYNWRRTAIAIVVTATVTGASGYLLGIRTNQNIPQSTQRVTFQPSPTIAIQPSVSTPSPSPTQATPIPTLSMKIYRNERLGFEFKYFEGYAVMEETTNGVTYGFNGIPYITISTNQITDYKSYSLCQGHWFRLIPNAWDREDFCQG